MNDTIFVTGLLIHAHHGVMEHEAKVGQRFVLDLELSLGGNVGDVRTTLDRAVDMLCDGVDTQLRAQSSHYLTPPWGIIDQPAFVNMCLAVDTVLSPRALLERTQAVETALGRNRKSE